MPSRTSKEFVAACQCKVTDVLNMAPPHRPEGIQAIILGEYMKGGTIILLGGVKEKVTHNLIGIQIAKAMDEDFVGRSFGGKKILDADITANCTCYFRLVRTY